VQALEHAWRSLLRLVGHAGASSTEQDGGIHSRHSVGRWLDGMTTATDRLSRPFQGWQLRLEEQLQEQQRKSRLAWERAIRDERRAKRRALTLLLGLLNETQRETFRRLGYVLVTGGSTGDLYRIRVEINANIDVLRPDGTVRCRLCVLPAGGVPVYDVMAAQLLHLQDPSTEKAFLRKANIYPAERASAFGRSVWM
jgi:hypothetical protein